MEQSCQNARKKASGSYVCTARSSIYSGLDPYIRQHQLRLTPLRQDSIRHRDFDLYFRLTPYIR